MMTSSNGNIFRVTGPLLLLTGEFPSQRPVTRSFDVFLDLHLNKRLSKQSRRGWLKTPSRSLWRHFNAHRFLWHVTPWWCNYSYTPHLQLQFNQTAVEVTVWEGNCTHVFHNVDVIMGTMASQITSLTIVYSTVYSDADQRKHQSSASLAFVRGIHRGPVNSPHKWPVTRKMFPFDDVIMFFVFIHVLNSMLV